MNCIKIGILCSVLILQIIPHIQGRNSRKVVKLIVPHTIKYIHHTHVLLVKPKKKKKPISEDVEEESNYDYHHITLPRRKHRYVVPYADAKAGHTGNKARVEYNQYLIPEHDTNKLPLHHHTTKPVKLQGSSYIDYPKRYTPRNKEAYSYSSYSDEPSVGYRPYVSLESSKRYLPRPFLDPDQFETKYLGHYDTYSDDYSTQPTEATSWTSPVEAAYAEQAPNTYMTIRQELADQ